MKNTPQQVRRDYINSRYKSAPCVDCGVQYLPCVMEFDHVRGQKAMGISEMVQGHFSLEDIDNEVAKCELVCANCHRIRTHHRKHGDH